MYNVAMLKPIKANSGIKKIFITIFTGVCTINMVVLAAPNKGKGQGRAAPVVVVAARLQQMAPITWVAGTVISRNDARLATEVDGRLREVAEVGSLLKEDGIVAVIDNTFVKLRIEELKSAVGRERAQLKFLRQEVKRLNRLAKQNNTAQTRLEQTQADREVAYNDLQIARVRLRHAKEEKSRHVIRAPFPGVVAERYMRPGERASAGDEIVRLIDPATLEVQARATLASFNFVAAGETLSIIAEQIASEPIKGIVRAIVPMGDDRSRLMDLRLSFSEKIWRVGQQVRVGLPTAIPREVLAVPRDALVLRRSGVSVFRINGDNKAEKLPVTVGIASGDFIEISGKVKPGDKIVVRGSERLRPGQTVKVIPN